MDSLYTYLVCVRCFTFNQHAYIEDAMNGFCMQKTDFPFVCIIVDDASTDGESEVIKRYFQTYFDLQETEETDDYVLNTGKHKTNGNCYFVVLYLKYNHKSIEKDKFAYFSKWHDNCKYLALCEGDDYWIDENKLQKQVDFLEKNDDYSMVCCKTKLFSTTNKRFIHDNACYKKSQKMRVRDIIEKGGLYISTCSLVYRSSVLEAYPEYCKKCLVGDYPLQIMCAMKGNCYYLNIPMAVYRVDNQNSWMGNQRDIGLSPNRENVVVSEIRMMQGFINDFSCYKQYFLNGIQNLLIKNTPRVSNYNRYKDYVKSFSYFVKTFNDEIEKFDIMSKIKLLKKSTIMYYIWKKNRSVVVSIIKRVKGEKK